MSDGLNERIKNFTFPIIIVDDPECQWLCLEFKNEDTGKVEFVVKLARNRESNLGNLDFHETMYNVYRHNIDLKNYTYTDKNYNKKGE